MNRAKLREVRIELVDNIEKFNKAYRQERHKVIMLRNKQGACLKKKNIEHAEAYAEEIQAKLIQLNAIRETAKNMASMLTQLYQLERKAS